MFAPYSLPELPKLKDSKWIPAGLPVAAEPWQLDEKHSAGKAFVEQNAGEGFIEQIINKTTQFKPWKFPNKQIFFISDPHADAEGFVASLIASGGVIRTGKKLTKIKLSKAGKQAVFVIGGDCLDKGPSNLKLLNVIKKLKDIGATVKLLAGNHDMRLLMGLRCLSLGKDLKTEHLFVRMGKKVIPLFQEVYRQYLHDNQQLLEQAPDLETCRRYLYPSDNWFEQFPIAAKDQMSPHAIEKEVKRMRSKVKTFESECLEKGLTLRHVYLIVEKCQQLFLHKNGEYSWFFSEMKLAWRSESFLFVHAGCDDQISELIATHGVSKLNKEFRRLIAKDLFTFYFGVLANVLRTKYRNSDLPLSDEGVEKIHQSGIHAIVHGHINRHQGQRINLNQGLLHIEADITIDRNSREKEGLSGVGMGTTIIHPKRKIIGISNDYPYAKVFEPESILPA